MAIFNSVRAYIYIYEGLQGVYNNDNLKYRITKDRLPIHEDAVIEIGEMVSDYLSQSYNGTVYNTSPLWVTVVAAFYDDVGAELNNSPKTYNYLALDGYGYFEEGINPELSTVVLQSNNTIYLEEGSAATIPIWAEETPTISVYNSSNVLSQTLNITDTGFSNQKVQYITLPTGTSKVIVDGVSEEKTINIIEICENIYTPYKVTFLNRYGALQTITFFKKSKESMGIKDETFKGNILNVNNRNYSISEGQKTRYNINAQDTITLNTGYVEEDYNKVIEELLLSQKTWINYESKTLAIIPKTKSMQYKTDINDGLINYTLSFDFAYDKVNLIR